MNERELIVNVAKLVPDIKDASVRQFAGGTEGHFVCTRFGRLTVTHWISHLYNGFHTKTADEVAGEVAQQLKAMQP